MRISGTADDTLLTALLKAAIERLEEYTALKFINQTWNVYFDNFGYKEKNLWWDGERDGALSMLNQGNGDLELPFGRLRSIGAFNTYADDNMAIAFSASNFNIDTISNVPRISLKIGQIWPATILRGSNGIEIKDAIFGFGAADTNVPDAIKTAIMLTTSKLYENRGDSPSGEYFGTGGFTIPNTAQMLLTPYLRHRVT